MKIHFEILFIFCNTPTLKMYWIFFSPFFINSQRPRQLPKITFVHKYVITFEPLILSECFEKCRKAEILRFSEIVSIAYILTTFIRLKKQCISSEPNRNDCYRLVPPPPCPDWFKRSHIQPINTGFGLLNHCLASFLGNLSKCKVKVKCVVRA